MACDRAEADFEFAVPPEAPVFEPTNEEFHYPRAYIAKIRPIASTKMYALVQYAEDNIYYVCKSNLVSNKKGITKVTYSDGHKYVASIIAKNDDKRMLLELKENIFKNRPHIFCRKLNIDNANSKKTDRLNKNCEIKTNANNTIFCGIDKPNISIEGNENQDKTEAGKKHCNNQITDLPTSFDINAIPFFDENGEDISIVTQNRDCDIQADFLLYSDIDKPITFIDKNGNQEKTEAEKENCDNQIINLPTFCDSVDVHTCNPIGNDFLETDNIGDADVSLSGAVDVHTCNPIGNDFLETDNIGDADVSLSGVCYLSVQEASVINMKEIKGKSKNSIVYAYKGYIYNMDKRLRGTYRCSTRRTTGCRGLAKVGDDGKVTINPSHDHAPDTSRMQKFPLKQEMLRLSRETLQTPKDIFDDVSRRDPETAALMAFKSIRSQLTRERLKSRPKLPQSIAALADELIHYTPISHIYKGSVTASDGKTAFLFSDDKLLIALESSNEIYCDGTFSVVPRVPSLSQLYTIHIRYMDKVIAAVFVLCEARTAALYEEIWSKVIEFAPGLRANIKFIMTDYECAAMSAMEKYFPNATIHGCWFHFNQALQRKWNHLGLRNSPSVILSMTMTLPLLPEQYFTEAYHILCNTCEEKDPDYDKIREFLTYVEKTWLSKTSKVSVYKCPVRTNNAVESFHNVINRKLGGHHPNVWLFLEKLGNVIIDQTIDLKRLYNNEEVRSVRSRKSTERDKKILQAQLDLISERLPLQQFLRMFIGKLHDYRYKESSTIQRSEDILDESSMINETDPTPCKNTATEICTSTDILLEPHTKIQRLSEKNFVKEKNQRVLKSIENFDKNHRHQEINDPNRTFQPLK